VLRQNKVNPFGELVAVLDKGGFMGNRGVLHDDQGMLTDKRWTHRQWIICDLEYKDSKKKPRTLMRPGCYTELFFLDEATALAAGHRPCAECRRADFKRFKAAWIQGNAHLGFTATTNIAEIDRVMQRERVAASREKVTYEDELGNLPDGAFFALQSQSHVAYLRWGGSLWRWSPAGYEKAELLSPKIAVNVLTPASTVNAIRSGYEPLVTL
jgi:hypothetical protein